MNIVTSIPSSPSNGDAILLRIGISPYDYVLLVFDATYGKWVSESFPIMANASEGLIGAVLVDSTTSAAQILGTLILVGNYKGFYDAGLRPQIRCTGRFENNDASGTATCRGHFASGNHHVGAATVRSTTAGVTSEAGNTLRQRFDSGWQELANPNPSSDVIAFLRLELVRNTAGQAALFDRQWWLRWVNTP